MTTKQNTNSSATFENMPELKVGTVLVANLGWSMVLPTFYRIVARTESSIWTKEIRSIASASDEYGTSGTVDGHYASVWDGKPRMYDYMD